MVALKAQEIDKFLARPDAAHPIVLVYGPDAGLVRERIDALVASSVDDTADPFSLARLEGEDISANPSRLVEEAHTIPLFGGRRAVWLRAGARHNIAPALEALIEQPPRDCRVIIEAGDLKKTAPLRSLCEKAKSAVAIPCYTDGVRDILRLIDDELREHQLTISPDARTALASLLGGDRLASRSEVRKLALYAQGKERVELDDVMAVVADAAALGTNGVIDAAFAGKVAEVEVQFSRALADNSNPGAIIGAALRQTSQLHKMRMALDGGSSMDDAIRRTPPPVHFSRMQAIESALRAWTAPRLLRAMTQLAEAALDVRRQPALAQTLTQRALMALAVNVRRRES